MFACHKRSLNTVRPDMIGRLIRVGFSDRPFSSVRAKLECCRSDDYFDNQVAHCSATKDPLLKHYKLLFTAAKILSSRIMGCHPQPPKILSSSIMGCHPRPTRSYPQAFRIAIHIQQIAFLWVFYVFADVQSAYTTALTERTGISRDTHTHTHIYIYIRERKKGSDKTNKNISSPFLRKI